MILFTETVYRKAFTGSAADYSDLSTWRLLGSATQMLLQVNTYSETDFTLTVVLEGSWDGIAWNEVDSDTVSVSKDTRTTSFLSMKQASATGTWAPLQRLKLSPSATATLFMEVIATGRQGSRGPHPVVSKGTDDACGSCSEHIPSESADSPSPSTLRAANQKSAGLGYALPQERVALGLSDSPPIRLLSGSVSFIPTSVEERRFPDRRPTPDGRPLGPILPDRPTGCSSRSDHAA